MINSPTWHNACPSTTCMSLRVLSSRSRVFARSLVDTTIESVPILRRGKLVPPVALNRRTPTIRRRRLVDDCLYSFSTLYNGRGPRGPDLSTYVPIVMHKCACRDAGPSSPRAHIAPQVPPRIRVSDHPLVALNFFLLHHGDCFDRLRAFLQFISARRTLGPHATYTLRRILPMLLRLLNLPLDARTCAV